jgi:hypothetical protein
MVRESGSMNFAVIRQEAPRRSRISYAKFWPSIRTAFSFPARDGSALEGSLRLTYLFEGTTEAERWRRPIFADAQKRGASLRFFRRRARSSGHQTDGAAEATIRPTTVDFGSDADLNVLGTASALAK